MQAQPKPQPRRFHTDFSSPFFRAQQRGERSEERGERSSEPRSRGSEEGGEGAAAEGRGSARRMDEEERVRNATTATSLRHFQLGRV